MDKLVATIERTEPDIVRLEISKESEIIKKRVSMKDFTKLITEASEKKEKGIRVGKLPYGFVDAVFYGEGFDVVVSIPPQVRPLMYFEDVYTIPFPRLVFCFSVRDGKVKGKRCFSAKDEPLFMESELCHYPFPNVGTGGSICYGGNSIPECEKLVDVEQLVRLFLEAPSNNDLWTSDFCNRKFPAVRFLLEELNGKDTFPEEYLKATGSKVKDLLV